MGCEGGKGRTSRGMRENLFWSSSRDSALEMKAPTMAVQVNSYIVVRSTWAGELAKGAGGREDTGFLTRAGGPTDAVHSPRPHLQKFWTLTLAHFSLTHLLRLYFLMLPAPFTMEDHTFSG